MFSISKFSSWHVRCKQPKTCGPNCKVAASSAAKHQPLLDAKVENEDVEEAMAEAIASPKKGHSHSSHSSHSIPSQPIEVSQVSQAPKVEPEGLAEEEIAQIAIACRMGEIEVVKAFVEKAAAEAKSHESAHLEGRLPCEALLDEYGESLLHHAAHGGHGEIVRILLELGQVQPDIPNARNETALSVACRKADEAVALELLKAAANPNRCASDGLTPFLAAVLGSASLIFAEDDVFLIVYCYWCLVQMGYIIISPWWGIDSGYMMAYIYICMHACIWLYMQLFILGMHFQQTQGLW